MNVAEVTEAKKQEPKFPEMLEIIHNRNLFCRDLLTQISRKVDKISTFPGAVIDDTIEREDKPDLPYSFDVLLRAEMENMDANNQSLKEIVEHLNRLV